MTATLTVHLYDAHGTEQDVIRRANHREAKVTADAEVRIRGGYARVRGPAGHLIYDTRDAARKETEVTE